MEKRKIKICIILGTRPEIIKMSPVIRECQKRKMDHFVLHTGQHYSPEMDEIFFKELDIPAPKYNLGVGSQPYRKQVGIMIKEITPILIAEKPDVVVVQGDTISVLAGALAANKLGIKVAHHEAGLRSHDPAMLEETNRIIVDHISDFLMVPTASALRNLKQEKKNGERIFYTGNTIVDSVRQNIKLADKKVDVLSRLGLKKKKYMLATCHRAENVDKKYKLEDILKGLSLVHQNLKNPIIFPIHPRTRKNIAEFGLALPEGVRAVEPVGFLEFLQLEKNASLILTDSGGAQEEACILQVPCVTLRANTERPETLKNKSNVLSGAKPEKILKCAQLMLKAERKWENPFGDGKAAERIIDAITENYA